MKTLILTNEGVQWVELANKPKEYTPEVDIRTIGKNIGTWEAASIHIEMAEEGITRHRANLPPDGNPEDFYTATNAIGIMPDETIKGIHFTSQAERELFELTPWGQSIPMAPHLNAQDGTPRRFRPEIIKKRLSCSWENAFKVAAALRNLEADHAVSEHYIEAIRTASTEKEKLAILAQLETLAQEVQLVTFDEDEELTRSWCEYGKNAGPEETYARKEWYNRVGFLPSCEDYKIPRTERIGSFSAYDEEEAKAGYVEDDVQIESWEEVLITPDRPMETFSYGQFDDRRNERPDWLESQPEHYRQLIDRVKHGSLDVFKATAIHREYDRKAYFDQIAKTTRKPRIFKALSMILKGAALDVPQYDSQKFPENAPEIARLMDDDFQGTIARHYECNPADDDAVEHWTPEDQITGFSFNPAILAVFDFLKTQRDKDDFQLFLQVNSSVEKPMTNDRQRSFFWTCRKIRKKAIEQQQDAMIDRSERKQSKQILQRIAEQESLQGIKSIARNIMNFAKSDKCKVPEAHWTVIWRHYHEAKKSFA